MMISIYWPEGHDQINQTADWQKMGQPTDRPKVNVRQAKNTSIFPMIWVLFLLETIISYQTDGEKKVAFMFINF